jgi:predicted small secreted protein
MLSFNIDPRNAVMAVAFLGLLGVSACNTVRGAGQDLEKAGEAVATTSQEVQRDLNDGNPKTP